MQRQRWQLVVASALVLALGVEILRRQTAREFGAQAPKPAPVVHEPD